MIIADTSVWIDHIRGLDTPMEDLLGQSRIALHAFVLGELKLNGLPKRGPFSLASFLKIRPAPIASPAEVAAFIDWAELAGKGVGYVDAHLLLAARMTAGASLLTTDRNLKVQAQRFGIDYQP